VKEAVHAVAAAGSMKMNMMRGLMKTMTKMKNRESAAGIEIRIMMKATKRMKTNMKIRVMKMRTSMKMRIKTMRITGEEGAVVEEVHQQVAEAVHTPGGKEGDLVEWTPNNNGV
jgi:hypothetical protein